jgi:hypothetical protein
LAQARDAELADIEILGSGHGLHWPALDADFTVPGLLMGVFGTRAWMASELARRAGQAKSPAKAAAARANGRKGGRPVVKWRKGARLITSEEIARPANSRSPSGVTSEGELSCPTSNPSSSQSM